MRNLASFSTSHNFELLESKMQQDIRTLKQTSSLPYVLTKFGEVGSTHPCKPFISRAPYLKLHDENVLNRHELSRRLFDFAQILYRV